MFRKVVLGPLGVPVPGVALGRRRMARPGTVSSSLQHVGFRRCIEFYVLAGMSRSMATVPVATALFAVTGSTSWVAAAAVARLLPILLVSWLGGVLADRFDRRRLLVTMTAAQALLGAGLALAVHAATHPTIIIGSIAAATIAMTPFFPTVAAALPGLVPDEDLVPAGIVVNGLETLSWIVGPGLGGVLLVMMPAGPACAIAAVVSALALVVVPRPTAMSTADDAPIEGSIVASIGNGLRTIRADSRIAVPLLLVIVVNVLLGAGAVAFVVVAEELLHTGASGVGVLNTALGAGGIVGLVASNRLAGSARPVRALAIATVVAGLGVALLSVVGAQSIAVILLFTSGAASVMTEAAALSILLRMLPPAMVGRVFGLVDSLLVGSILLGSVTMPAAIGLFGLRLTLILVAGVFPVVAATAVMGRHRSREAAVAMPVTDEPKRSMSFTGQAAHDVAGARVGSNEGSST